MIRFRPSVESLSVRVMPSDWGTIGLLMVQPPDLTTLQAPVKTMLEIQMSQPSIFDLNTIDWTVPTIIPPPLDTDGDVPVPLDADDPSVILYQRDTTTRIMTITPE